MGRRRRAGMDAATRRPRAATVSRAKCPGRAGEAPVQDSGHGVPDRRRRVRCRTCDPRGARLHVAAPPPPSGASGSLTAAPASRRGPRRPTRVAEPAAARRLRVTDRGAGLWSRTPAPPPVTDPAPASRSRTRRPPGSLSRPPSPLTRHPPPRRGPPSASRSWALTRSSCQNPGATSSRGIPRTFSSFSACASLRDDESSTV